jgi:hypothetical protein
MDTEEMEKRIETQERVIKKLVEYIRTLTANLDLVYDDAGIIDRDIHNKFGAQRRILRRVETLRAVAAEDIALQKIIEAFSGEGE